MQHLILFMIEKTKKKMCDIIKAYEGSQSGQELENRMAHKRREQLREAWIKNLIRVLGFSEHNAKKAYDKIQPYN